MLGSTGGYNTLPYLHRLHTILRQTNDVHSAPHLVFLNVFLI